MTEDISRNQKNYIGYLALIEDPSHEYFHEAIFIVDDKGYPIDYAYTDRLDVTPAQRILYGKTLNHYIGVEVCGPKLVEEINQKPLVIIVNHKDLLDLRKKIGIPMIFLDDSKKSHDRQKPDIIPHKDYQEDLSKIKRLIDTCSNNYDIMEPFDRITKAIMEEI